MHRTYIISGVDSRFQGCYPENQPHRREVVIILLPVCSWVLLGGTSGCSQLSQEWAAGCPFQILLLSFSGTCWPDHISHHFLLCPPGPHLSLYFLFASFPLHFVFSDLGHKIPFHLPTSPGIYQNTVLKVLSICIG